jgi:DNA-binding response OmpR family regulator
MSLRELDPVIGIIAISGVATAELAAELVRVGADDYFDKRDLTSGKLARSVRAILRRTDTVRRRMPGSISDTRGQMVEHLVALCEYFADRVGGELVQRLQTFATAARLAQLRAADLEALYVSACARIATAGRVAPIPAELLLRPLMLELTIRILGDGAELAFEEITGGCSAP